MKMILCELEIIAAGEIRMKCLVVGSLVRRALWSFVFEFSCKQKYDFQQHKSRKPELIWKYLHIAYFEIEPFPVIHGITLNR